MTENALSRICIAATASSAGKTTFTCGLLRALLRRGLHPAAFKCGPDYIDPMFHREVAHAPSANLDLFFFEPDVARQLMQENAAKAGADIAVIEGVMGYYDGLGGKTVTASTWELAYETKTPVLLLIDCKGLSVSAAAVAKGFHEFKAESGIAGVVLNRVPARLYPELKDLIEREAGVSVLGYLPYKKESAIESRHLGLVTAEEIENLQGKVDRIAAQIEETVELEALIKIAESAPALLTCHSREITCHSRAGGNLENNDGFEIPAYAGMTEVSAGITDNPKNRVRIGVARDAAFCFYYEDSLRLLEKLGAELVPFSPLRDARLPDDLRGLYLGGGYPELYLPRLEANTTLRKEIKAKVDGGLPCIAECGGFLYLHEKVADAEGKTFEMAGVLTGECKKTAGLVRFGYATYRANEDSLLCAEGESIRGHEFHYWESDRSDCGYTAEKAADSRRWDCIASTKTLHAGFPHIHFYAKPEAARRFVDACVAYAKAEKKLRCGYTTGTCAAAAAKAATALLLEETRGQVGPPLSGTKSSAACSAENFTVEIKTPSGKVLRLSPEDARITRGTAPENISAPRTIRSENITASCAIRKDSGDDPDVTNGVLVYAHVTMSERPGVHIDGGEGVGRVTKPGLERPVGAAAINNTPLRMIEENVMEIAERACYEGGLDVMISIPDGEVLAAKTFNPRLGVVGGISVLGTSGIVVPMSDDALVKTIRAELSVLRASGADRVVLTPGNYGRDFLKGFDQRPEDEPVICSNFIGDSIDMAVEFGFRELLLVGHIGKLIKLVTGNFNTHSKYGDPRSAVLTAFTAQSGGDAALCRIVSDCVTTESALEVLNEQNLLKPVVNLILAGIQQQIEHRSGGSIKIGAVLFSSVLGYLGASDAGERMLKEW